MVVRLSEPIAFAAAAMTALASWRAAGTDSGASSARDLRFSWSYPLPVPRTSC